jgi:putrescine transport system permease protein
MRRASAFNLAAIVLGIVFLYLPIAILVIYSFSASRLVAVWGGWSTRWYVELLQDAPLLESAFISVRLALTAATAATMLGTLAALALVRFGRFRGRLLFAAMIYAPLVMPEVITGLSLLLLFVAIAVDRGFWTVAIAHTTMAMCFVTVIVQARLADFDMSLEEAAMDLGASPLRTFLSVTLPLILPAVAAAWMLAFALSLDDLVIASFTTGPGATTLPIRIYSEVRLGVKPEMNAVCSIMIAVVGVAVIAASLLAKLTGARGAAAQPRSDIQASAQDAPDPGRAIGA